MTKKNVNKKPKSKYQKIEFTVEEIYPPKNDLAVDILRLEAAYNDQMQLLSWILSQNQMPSKKGSVSSAKYAISMGIKYRLLYSIMWEGLQVVSSMQSNSYFTKTLPFLTDEGNEALAKLIKVIKGKETSLFSKLKKGRNKFVFHYDHDAFSKSLKDYISVTKQINEPTSKFFRSQNDEFHFSLPEHVRDFGYYGLSDKDNLEIIKRQIGNLLTEAQQLLPHFRIFLHELFLAYLKERKIDTRLNIGEVYE